MITLETVYIETSGSMTWRVSAEKVEHSCASDHDRRRAYLDRSSGAKSHEEGEGVSIDAVNLRPYAAELRKYAGFFSFEYIDDTTLKITAAPTASENQAKLKIETFFFEHVLRVPEFVYVDHRTFV